MSLRSLIKGETISIDNHNRGVAMDIDDRSIHLHKRFNKDNKRFRDSEVTVDLNRNNMKITSSRGTDHAKIIKEIQQAFQDGLLRRAFVDDMIDRLNNLALFADNADYFRIDDQTQERALTQAGENKIREIINRVYDHFRGPAEELKSLQYDQSKGVIAQFSQNQYATSQKTSILSDRLIDMDIHMIRPKSYYVKADLHNKSFSLSSSRKELTGDNEK